jgi:hypothetical protein
VAHPVILSQSFGRLLMKVFLLLSIVLTAALASAQIRFTAALSGAEETPPVNSAATGTGSFTLSEDFTQISWVITYEGLSGTLTAGGHFHTGTPGRPGPVVKAIGVSGDPVSNTISGVWKTSDATQPLTPALVESLLTGRMYVNFHTSAHPGGEIRGQVNLATALEFTVDYDGAQEVPPVSTTGGGTGVFVLSPDRSSMTYTITYRDLSGTLTAGGHVHTGAAGQNGAVVKSIANSGDPASALITGTWNSSDGTEPLTGSLVDSLIAGKLYSNFHTAAHPGGEIRGQLRLAGGTGFVNQLDASQEVPPTGVAGQGSGYIVLSDARSSVRYAITYINLTGPLTAGGHFHTGSAGRNGPVVKSIATSGGPASGTVSGTWNASDATQPLTTALTDSLLSGRMYVNFHTAAHAGGEIRGQVALTTGTGFTVQLDGADEVPPNSSAGRGSGFVVLNATRDNIRYGFTYYGLTGTLTAGGHFHTGAPGVSGPVVKVIATSGLPADTSVGGNWTGSDQTQPLTGALVDSLFAGRMYVNFHTATDPGGEIRGQVAFASSGVTDVAQISSGVPAAFSLHQNYPNPFNPSTTITFDVPKATRVSLRVFNLLGQAVADLVNEVKEPGTYGVMLDASRLASGVYLYRLSTGTGETHVKKMLLLK